MREDALIAGALLLAAGLVLISRGTDAPEPTAWAATLVFLALPNGLAVALAIASTRAPSSIQFDLTAPSVEPVP